MFVPHREHAYGPPRPVTWTTLLTCFISVCSHCWTRDDASMDVVRCCVIRAAAHLRGW
jgi:hypothetical protein